MMDIVEIGGILIAGDILTESFGCDLQMCGGACCVAGDSGAPLEEDELTVLKNEYSHYQSFMTPEGRAVVEQNGFYVYDDDGEPTTVLFAPNAACAYSYIENGITLCAIECAYFEGMTSFRKPISCHLYPVRVKRFSDGSMGLNYHRWSVCSCSKGGGKPIYMSVREAVERRFGKAFYAQLDEAAHYLTAPK